GRSSRRRSRAGTASPPRPSARRRGRSTRRGTSAGAPAGRPRPREFLSASEVFDRRGCHGVRFACQADFVIKSRRARYRLPRVNAGPFGAFVGYGTHNTRAALCAKRGDMGRLWVESCSDEGATIVNADTPMRSESTGRHTDFLKSLVEFTKDHRAARWSGT